MDTWCKRRATKPSTQSVAPRTASRMAASVWRWSPKRSQRNSGTQASRTGGDHVGDGEDPVERGRLPSGALGHARCSLRPRRSVLGPLPGRCGTRAVPRFEPFTGLRYDPAIPLDRSSPRPTTSSTPRSGPGWPSRHLANAIHVELPVDDPRTGLDRYQSAAASHLVDRGGWSCATTPRLLRLPDDRARRSERPPGSSAPSAATRPGSDVLPHEQTMPKDTTDRLDLLRACRQPLPHLGLSLPRGCPRRTRDGPPDGRGHRRRRGRSRPLGPRRPGGDRGHHAGRGRVPW